MDGMTPESKPIRRVTAQEVVDSLKRQNLKAVTGVWTDSAYTGEGCTITRVGCCGLGALTNEKRPNQTILTSVVIAALDLTTGYTTGFVQGFDGVPRSEFEMTKGTSPLYMNPEEMELGYQDGFDARDAVTHASLWLEVKSV